MRQIIQRLCRLFGEGIMVMIVMRQIQMIDVSIVGEGFMVMM